MGCDLIKKDQPITLPDWLSNKVLPVIRSTSPEEALWIANCLYQAGATVLEFTLTIPDVWQVYQQFTQTHHEAQQKGQLYVGMGSLKTIADLDYCLNQPVAFTASPGYIPQSYTLAKQANHCHIGGAITPSELNQVVLEGGRCVKLFPIVPLGGVGYFKTVTNPFPELTCIPFGGICPTEVGSYFNAGAITVGLGSQLMPPKGWFEDNRQGEYLAFLKTLPF